MIVLIDASNSDILQQMEDGVIKALKTVIGPNNRDDHDDYKDIKLISDKNPIKAVARRVYVTIEPMDKVDTVKESELKVEIAHETQTALHRIKFCKKEVMIV